jgi:hypothetical protein
MVQFMEAMIGHAAPVVKRAQDALDGEKIRRM